MKKILVSKCLYGGEPVRYDGKSKAETDERFLKWKEEGRLIPICPEVFGGLPTPRSDAQRRGDRVVARSGADVTEAYMTGAKEAVRIAQENNVICAVMKEKSPSCGSSHIYDGTFSGNLIQGEGMATEHLRAAGFAVYSEEELHEVEKLLAEYENQEKNRNIILIGMPACGKSVTGVVMAKALGMKFTDTDLLIQEAAGKSLQRIIDEDGIEAFRNTERDVLCSLEAQNTVIATGGSAVYYDEAMEHLGKNSVIIYIRISIKDVKMRLKNIRTRGVAMRKGQTLEELYGERVPLYEKYADITVDSHRGSMEKTVEKMLDAIKSF